MFIGSLLSCDFFLIFSCGHPCYRPRSEASEGYVFTGVCHSFCPQMWGGGGGLLLPRMHHWSHDHTGGVCLLGKVCLLGGGGGGLPSWQGRPPWKADHHKGDPLNTYLGRPLLKYIFRHTHP